MVRNAILQQLRTTPHTFTLDLSLPPIEATTPTATSFFFLLSFCSYCDKDNEHRQPTNTTLARLTFTPTPWGADAADDDLDDDECLSVIQGAASHAKLQARVKRRGRPSDEAAALSAPPHPHPPSRSHAQPRPSTGAPRVAARPAALTSELQRETARVLRAQPSGSARWNNPATWEAASEYDAESVVRDGCPVAARLYLLGLEPARLAALRAARRSLLHGPASRGHLAVLILLVAEFRFDPSVVLPGKGAPLHSAARSAQPRTAHYLLTFDDAVSGVNAADPQTQATPLHEACGAGCVETLRLLLAQGARVNALNAAGETPLVVACRRGREAAAVALLREGGGGCGAVVLDHAARGHRTAVSHALAGGHLALLRALLEAGATLAPPLAYFGPLQLACRNAARPAAALATARFLVEGGHAAAGGDPAMVHCAPKALAERAGNAALVEYLDEREKEEAAAAAGDVCAGSKLSQTIAVS